MGKTPYAKMAKFGPNRYDDMATGESVWRMLNVERDEGAKQATLGDSRRVAKAGGSSGREPALAPHDRAKLELSGFSPHERDRLARNTFAHPKDKRSNQTARTPAVPARSAADSQVEIAPSDVPSSKSISNDVPERMEFDEGLAEAVYHKPQQTKTVNRDPWASLPGSAATPSSPRGLVGASRSTKDPQPAGLSFVPDQADRRPPYILIFTATVTAVLINAAFLQYMPKVLGPPSPSWNLDLKGPMAANQPSNVGAPAVNSVNVQLSPPRMPAVLAGTGANTIPTTQKALAQPNKPTVVWQGAVLRKSEAPAATPTLILQTVPPSTTRQAHVGKAAAVAKPLTEAKVNPALAKPQATIVGAGVVSVSGAATPARSLVSGAPTKGPMVQVGAFPSSTMADDAWSRVSAAMAGQMAGKSKAMQTTIKDGKTYYRSLVQGFGSDDEAKAFCDSVAAKGIACFLRR